MNQTYKAITFIAFFSFIISCKTEKTEVEYSKQLKDEVIKELTVKLNPTDSVFIVLHRMLGVCGNDERYDGTTTLSERMDEIKYNKEKPYFVDVDKGFNEIYQINGKTIITGSAIDNKFESKSISFDNDSLKVKKRVYDIQFESVKKDTVYVSLFDFINEDDKPIKLRMVLNNSKWKNEGE